MGDLVFRNAETQDIEEIHHILSRVFGEHVAPGYQQEGIQEFLTYIEPAALDARLNKNHFMLLCCHNNTIVGVIEIRNNDHVSLLFVDTAYHRKGIARRLLNMVLDICRKNNPELKEVTVHSSPNAVPIYERLGFQATKEEQLKNGIRFIPMKLPL